MLRRIWLIGAAGLFLIACSFADEPSLERTPPPVTFVTPQVDPTSTKETEPLSAAQPTARPPVPTPTLAYHFCDPGSVVVNVEFPLARPISSEGRNYVDSSYRYGSTAGGLLEAHTGVELVNSTGTPVLAAAIGRVVHAGDDADGSAGPYRNYYGFLVVIEHSFAAWDEPVYTLYGHLSEVLVEEGDEVQAGEEVGVVGASGIALGSHLHFEVRLGENRFENTVNPELWLAPRLNQDQLELGVLAGYVINPEGDLLSLNPIVVDYLLPEDHQGDEGPRTFFLEPYRSPLMNSDPRWGENFAAGDVLPGDYLVSTVTDGYREQHIEIRPGQLTLVAFCTGQ